MEAPRKTKKIKFDGQIYDFPDDATDAEISEALGGQQPAPEAAAPQAAQDQQSPSMVDQISRQVGLAGRYATEGLMTFPNMIGNAANSAVNMGIKGVNAAAGTNIPYLMKPSEATSGLLDKAGLPTPQNTTERIVAEPSRFIASLPAFGGMGQTLSKYGPESLSKLSTLADNYGTQAAGAIGGGGAYGVAKEVAPDSPAVQVAAALLGGGLGAGAVSRLSGTTANAAAPTIETLKDISRASYKAAEDAGAIIRPEAMQRLTAATQNQLAELGVDATLHPKTLAAFNRLVEASNGNITLKGLETIRRVAGEAAKSNEPSEQMMARQIINNIDDMVDNLKPADLVQGNKTEAVSALLKARSVWKQASKAERIQEAIDNARLRAATSGSGGNLDNAIRQEFAKIIKSDKLSRGFTKSELDAIEKVAKGTFTQNTLRTFGKMSPQGNGLMNYLGIGGLLSGGAFSVPPMIGLAAKPAAEAMTRNSAAGVLNRVLSGEMTQPEPNLSTPIAGLLSSIRAGAPGTLFPMLRGTPATATEDPRKQPQGRQ